MKTAFRTPDTLTIVVVRHPHRAETSMVVTHEEGGLVVEIFDDWVPTTEAQLHRAVSAIVEVWCRTGPLAAAAMATQWGRRRPWTRAPRD